LHSVFQTGVLLKNYENKGKEFPLLLKNLAPCSNGEHPASATGQFPSQDLTGFPLRT
jgi:hypothetical protein